MLSCGGLSFGAPVAVGIVRFSTAQDKLFYLCRPYRALILAFPLPRATPWAISWRPVGAPDVLETNTTGLFVNSCCRAGVRPMGHGVIRATFPRTPKDIRQPKARPQGFSNNPSSNPRSGSQGHHSPAQLASWPGTFPPPPQLLPDGVGQ